MWRPPTLIEARPLSPLIDPPRSLPPRTNQTIEMDGQQQQAGQFPAAPPNQLMNLGTGKCQPRTFSNDASKGESWLVFRVHFNHVAKLNDWTQRQARFYLASSMVGDAGQAVLHIPTEITNPNVDTLEDLLNKYQEIFLPPAQSETAKFQFEHMDQAAHESILHFASKLRCLYLHAYGDQDSEHSVILIRRFTYGLRNPAVQFKVMEMTPITYSSAIAIAVNHTSLKEVHSKVQGSKNNNNGTSNGVHQIQQDAGRGTTPRGVHAFPETSRPRNGNPNGNPSTGYNLSQIQCYHCGNRGHLARNCFQKRAAMSRGRGRPFRRPMTRNRPVGRSNNGPTYSGNRNNFNRGRAVGSGSVNAINPANEDEIDDKIQDLQEKIAALELCRTQDSETYQELTAEEY